MIDLRTRIERALDEDLGAAGDVTTDATVPADQTGRAVVVAKEPVVVSGQVAASMAFEVMAQRLGTFVVYKPEVADGDLVESGGLVGTVNGNLRAILSGERLALNLLMRMTGIASHVRRILQDLPELDFRVVDTRKTTPLWRDLEKAAVLHGGGHNHRFGLFDGILIKDNHIAAAGGTAAAVLDARRHAHHLLRIEVEVGGLEQALEALDAGADGVMLDNLDDATLRDAVGTIREAFPAAFIEASGNMDAARLRDLADSGLDVVSVGGFIHQARWADLSLRVTP